jgi:hypothetical protein
MGFCSQVRDGAHRDGIGGDMLGHLVVRREIVGKEERRKVASDHLVRISIAVISSSMLRPIPRADPTRRHSLEPDQRYPSDIHRILGLLPRSPRMRPRDALLGRQPRPHGEPRRQEQEPRHAR